MANILFLGIKQVNKQTFETSEKDGYIWFVRTNATDEKPEHFEVYLGSIKYGEINDDTEVKKLINTIKESVGLTDELGLPEDFNHGSIVSGITDLESSLLTIEGEITGITSDIETINNNITAITESVDEIKDDIIDNEEIVAKAISILRQFIGLDVNFIKPSDFEYNDLIEALKDRYTKTQIDELIKGAFKFKGVVKYKSDLDNIENPKNGDVYQVTYENAEQEAEGIFLNSEFVWVSELESTGEWVELGPLLDGQIKLLTEENIDDLFEEESDNTEQHK